MHTIQLLTCLWPGLARLWWRGQWKGLLSATFFAGLLNFALLATFVWPELFGRVLPVAGWLAVGAIWLYGAIVAYCRLPEYRSGHDIDLSKVDVDLFVQAQGEYLKGQWVEAESTLQRWLENRIDIEAILLLATIYRHTNRSQDAVAQLKRLQLLEGGEKWRYEVERELGRLRRSNASSDGASGMAAAA